MSSYWLKIPQYLGSTWLGTKIDNFTIYQIGVTPGQSSEGLVGLAFADSVSTSEEKQESSDSEFHKLLRDERTRVPP